MKRPVFELESFTVFRELSEDGKTLLKRGLHLKSYTNKTTIVEKGQTVSGALFVAKGKLRVFTITPDGNEATLYFIKPDEFCVFTLNCIFNNQLYPAWVQTESETLIGVIPSELYRSLFQREEVIQDITVRAFATIVSRLMTELELIHSYKLEKRLANFLLLTASSDGSLLMTQSEIAAHLGTTREVIARAMRQFVRSESVETSRGKIIIKQPTKFARLI
ncbi:MAG TPA: Crp/Fnr family transcriptional regulator [Pyrinomonadaceae bacterium]